MNLVISKTPVRISLFGGGSDYPAYFSREPGAILGTTINQYIYITVKKSSPFFPDKIRISYAKSEQVNAIEAIQHPSIRECLRFKGIDFPIEIHICSDLPAKTGLGSSSAFTVGLLHALYTLEKKFPSKEQLAEEACYVEQQLIQEKVGSQDQYHAAFGGCNILEFSSKKVTVLPLTISIEKKALIENNALLFYTGKTRYAESILQEQITNTLEKKNDSFLQEMVEQVYQGKDLLTEEKKEIFLPKLGALLDRSWQLKQLLSSQISNATIQSYYDKAKKAGAWGGKLCGAGQSGFLLLFAPCDRHKAIQEALRPLFPVKFSLESQGSSIIHQQG